MIDMGAMGGQIMATQDNDSYYASRADAMHTIESTIGGSQRDISVGNELLFFLQSSWAGYSPSWHTW